MLSAARRVARCGRAVSSGVAAAGRRSSGRSGARAAGGAYVGQRHPADHRDHGRDTGSRRAPISIEEHLRTVFPNVAIAAPRGKPGVDILVAGCGTGRHSFEVAQRYRGARVLAVDLSLASLGYAKRKTQAAGLNNVEY